MIKCSGTCVLASIGNFLKEGRIYIKGTGTRWRQMKKIRERGRGSSGERGEEATFDFNFQERKVDHKQPKEEEKRDFGMQGVTNRQCHRLVEKKARGSTRRRPRRPLEGVYSDRRK